MGSKVQGPSLLRVRATAAAADYTRKNASGEDCAMDGRGRTVGGRRCRFMEARMCGVLSDKVHTVFEGDLVFNRFLAGVLKRVS